MDHARPIVGIVQKNGYETSIKEMLAQSNVIGRTIYADTENPMTMTRVLSMEFDACDGIIITGDAKGDSRTAMETMMKLINADYVNVEKMDGKGVWFVISRKEGKPTLGIFTENNDLTNEYRGKIQEFLHLLDENRY